MLTFGKEGEMDFDVVFVDFLAKEEYFFVPLDGAAVVTVLEDLEVGVALLVPDDVAHHGGEGEQAIVRFEKDLQGITYSKTTLSWVHT